MQGGGSACVMHIPTVYMALGVAVRAAVVTGGQVEGGWCPEIHGEACVPWGGCAPQLHLGRQLVAPAGTSAEALRSLSCAVQPAPLLEITLGNTLLFSEFLKW